jgi:prophage DNA circulation protein
MNGREQKYSVALFVTVEISSLLILTISLAGTTLFRTTVGQSEDQQNTINTADSISNQTSNLTNQSIETVDSIQNQTMDNQTGTAALSANLTQSDFELLRQDLTEVRQALENNDTTTILDELNSASGELFQVISRQFDPTHVEAMTQEFSLLQTHLDQAQEEALKGDQARILEELNAAESELIKRTQMLPSTRE